MPRNSDPILNFLFNVQIDNIMVGGFSDVSGLESQIEVFTFNEGGLNNYTHCFPQKVKYNNIVLKKGIINKSVLVNWYESAVAGSIIRKNGVITLYNPLKQPLRMWEFENAFPVKYSGPQLKATGNEVAVESIELAHSGLKIIKVN